MNRSSSHLQAGQDRQAARLRWTVWRRRGCEAREEAGRRGARQGSRRGGAGQPGWVWVVPGHRLLQFVDDLCLVQHHLGGLVAVGLLKGVGHEADQPAQQRRDWIQIYEYTNTYRGCPAAGC